MVASAAQESNRDAVLIGAAFPPRVRHFAQALDQAQRLRALVTGFVYQEHRALEKFCSLTDHLVGTRLTRSLRRRALAGVDPYRCHRATAAEGLYQVCRRLPIIRSLKNVSREFHHLEVIDRYAARTIIDDHTKLVLGREDGALHSFHRAKQMGAYTVYDLPIAHYQTVRRILQREEAEFPGVSRKPIMAIDFAPERIDHKDAELEAADHMVVPSAFVRDSLLQAGFPAASISVLPSACEGSWFTETPSPEATDLRQSLVLHVGQLSLRKGTHRLLLAWKKLGAYRNYRLRLIGDMHLSPSFLRDFQGCFEHVSRLPREELRKHYSSAIAFVLPSAAEGFAAVILEALSCGVPIVASRNSGAEGFVEHNKHGLLHTFGDQDELCAHLDWMLSHPKERTEMARCALHKARSWTWPDYRERFLSILGSLNQAPQG